MQTVYIKRHFDTLKSKSNDCMACTFVDRINDWAIYFNHAHEYRTFSEYILYFLVRISDFSQVFSINSNAHDVFAYEKLTMSTMLKKKRPRNWKHTHACGRAWSCVVVRVRVIIPITDIKTHTVNWHRAVLDWFRHKLYDLSKNAVRKFDQFLFDFPRKHGFIYGDNAKLLLKLYTSQCCSLILSVLVRLCMYSCLCSGCNILAYEIQQRIYNDL